MQVLNNLERAVSLTDAFIAALGNAANTLTGNALNLHFKTRTEPVARHVRARLNSIRNDIRTLNPFVVECHDSWDPVCDSAGAYIPGGEAERMVFCSNFFQNSSRWQIETIVHEMAHTQTGACISLTGLMPAIGSCDF